MRLFGILLVLFPSNVLRVSSECQAANFYCRLRNPASGFVLDSRLQTTLAVYPPTNYSYQIWKVHPSSRIGLFNIVNLADGKAIDVETAPGSDGLYYATVNNLEDSIYQQWFLNSEGTIVNAGYHNHALRIRTGEINEGTPVVLWDRYGEDDLFENQLFAMDLTLTNEIEITTEN